MGPALLNAPCGSSRSGPPHGRRPQAALAFLPPARSGEERREIAGLIVALGALSGMVGAAVATGLPGLWPGLFVGDPALWPHMRSVGLQVRGWECGVRATRL